MSATGKRLDLRFGAFACSVQGFDDPVQPVQQILRAIQHLLEESPELSDTGINFDAEAIEQLVGEVARRAELDENEVEIIPGLVIIHHGAGGDLGAGDAPAAWSSDGDREPGDREPAGASGGDYVNIFTPSGGAAGEGVDDGAAASPEEDAEEGAGGDAAAGQEDFEDRLRQMAAGGDEYGWAEDGEEIREAGPGAAEDDKDADEDDDEDDEEPLNLFAGGVPAEEEADEQAETSAGGDATVRNLFSSGTQGEAWEPDAGEDEGAGQGAGTGEAAADVSAAALATRAEAGSVPELMVASAAWMVLTQGQTSFTRRDVLDVFETIPGDHETTPEARIKGFGKAVRNGQLVATSDGIFGLSRSELERFQELL